MTSETLKTFEEKTGVYAEASNILSGTVAEMDKEIAAIREKYTPSIVEQATHLSQARNELEAVILENPDSFKKPRTIEVNGVKIGFRKKAGKVIIESDSNTIKLIRKKLSEKADQLIVVKESISKTAAKTLTVKEAASIGVTLTADTDEVVISNEKSDIEKLVESFFKEQNLSIEAVE